MKQESVVLRYSMSIEEVHAVINAMLTSVILMASKHGVGYQQERDILLELAGSVNTTCEVEDMITLAEDEFTNNNPDEDVMVIRESEFPLRNLIYT